MKRNNIKRNSIIVLVTLLFSIFAGSFRSIVKAQEITATGTSGDEAIVTDSSGNIITDTSNTSKYQSYNIKWNFDIPNNVSIQQGDTLQFDLPEGMTANGNLNFEVKNASNIVIGNFKITQGQSYGILTFNDYYATHDEVNRHGSVHISANGS